MLQNIIRNTLRGATEYREINGWKVPRTSPDDLSLALKACRSAKPCDFGDTLAALTAIGREGRWIGPEQLSELASKTGSPVSFLRQAIGRVNAWLASLDEYVARFGRPFGSAGIRGTGLLFQGGPPTTMLLAGDSSALTAWALGQALVSGCPLLVKPSNVEPLSAFLFCRAVLDKGVRAPNLLFLDSSVEAERDLIRKALQGSAQSVVYGEDATVLAVYGSFPLSPMHKPIPYWTGRSGALVLPDADLSLAARCIIVGATLDRGNLCNSTKKVFAPRALQGALEQRLVSEADGLCRGSPLWEGTGIGRLDPAARRMAEGNLAGSRVFYDRDLVLAEAHDASPLLLEETPYPIVGVRYWDDGEDPVELANRTVRSTPSGRALVMAVFTSSEEGYGRAASLRAFKLQRNAPTSDVDHLEMHQGMHLALELMRPVVYPG